MTTAADGLPASLPFTRIEDVLRAIGIEARDCVSLTFGIDGVTIERIRTMPDGQSLIAGNSFATTTTVVGYARDDHAE